MLRKDIIQQMKKNIKEIEALDLEEMISETEKHAVEVENNLLKLVCNEDGEEGKQKIPVFDFEMN